jgi:glutathione synthase/RimK-type ligase-like ATP-grasp enzyme
MTAMTADSTGALEDGRRALAAGVWEAARASFAAVLREGERRCLDRLRERSWFRRQGAIVQEPVEPSWQDIRLVVANGRVVGGAGRRAAPGEWRSNVSLGGEIVPARLDEDVRSLAVAACAAVGTDLAGIDVIHGADGYTVIEVNGAVDFDERYALPGTSIFREVASAFGLLDESVTPAA